MAIIWASIVLTGPKPKEIKVETFRIDYLRRTPKVEKLSLQPISWGVNIRMVPTTYLGHYIGVPYFRELPYRVS